ncbi:AgmX/PglI C-terminal domain-containing protein [Myxococcaceae bacterium GXIMD 01537]
MASAQPHKLLRVGIIQGDRILEEHHVEQDSVSIGSDGRNTIVLPESDLLAPRFTLFEHHKGQYQLVFDEWMKGRVNLGSSDVDFTTVRKQGLAQARGDLFVIPLQDSARGKVELGDVTLFFQFVDPPPLDARPELPADVKGGVWRTMDRVFFGILAASLLVHFSGAALILSRETPREPELALEELHDRFVRAEIIPPKPAEPEKKVEAAQADTGPKEDKKPDKKDDAGEAKADAKPAADAAQRKAEVAKKVAGKGLLKILGAAGSGGGGAFADVLGGSTGGGDIAAALAGAGGVGVATEASIGGTGPRGGGSGSVAGIGEVGTSGGGSVDLGTKKEVQVQGRVKDFVPEVDSADVDRDKLAQYVKARIKSLTSCYEKELKRNPSLKGKLVVRFTIKPTGRIGEVDIEENTLNNDAVGSCIRSYIRGWVLPFKPDDDVAVSYPFVFSPAG